MTENEQLRADATADAETLRNVGMPYGPLAYMLSFASCHPVFPEDSPDKAYYYARCAARAAFHAVPDLRG